MRYLLTAILLLCLASPVMAKTYACVESDKTGFNYEDGRLKKVSFAEDKFIFKFNGSTATAKNSDGYKQEFICQKPYPTLGFELYTCVSGTTIISFGDAGDLFFNRASTLGGLAPPEVDSLTISYGTCTSFD